MKILFLRFSSIGDVVITSTIVRCVRNKYPEAELGFATKKTFSSLVKHNPNLNRIHELGNDFESFAKEIKLEQYTHVIDLHKNLRTKRLRAHMPKSHWFSFDKLNWQKWLLVYLKINKLPKKHITTRYFEGISSLGVTYDEQGMDFFFPEEYKPDISVQLPAKYTVFAIGGTYFTKRLPIDKIKEFILKSEEQIVLIGGADDLERSKDIDSPNLLNLCGQLSLLESAYLVKNSEKVMAHDSGFMHIAAALNKPLLSIWGNTVPDLGFYPLLKKESAPAVLLEKQAGLKCRPCSKLGYDKCPKGHFKCMDYSSEEIIKSLNALSE